MRAKSLIRTAVVAKKSRVDHRDGADHLEPAYAQSLYARASERAHVPSDRAVVSGTSSTDWTAEESGEEFVLTVASGEDAGADRLDDETLEERGGPFIETTAAKEFAYSADSTNPIGATREPFPTS